MKNEITICKDCGWSEVINKFTLSPSISGICRNPNAPVTNYVYGLKQCKEINNGNCPFFEKVEEA
jgi:hypothetical protein